MLSSLRGRLIASYVVVIVVCLLVLTAAVLVGVSRSVQEGLVLPRLETSLLNLRPFILALLDRGGTPEVIIQTVQQRAQGQEPTATNRLLFINMRRQIVADSAGEWTGQRISVPLERLTRAPGQPISDRLTMPNGEDFFFAAVPLGRNGSADTLFLATVASVQPWHRILRQPAFRQERNSLLGTSLQVGLVAFVVSVLLAVIIARSIARPLQRVAAAAKEVARGNYDLHLDIASPDEVRSVADSFNTMTQAVKASQQAQRDFVANVSHELRTPLTSIQGFSEAILDGTANEPESVQQAVRIIQDEADRMAYMVSQLLDLAKIEAGQIVMARKAVNLQAVLESCVTKMTPQAAQGDVALTTDLSGLSAGTRLTGDGDRLAQVLIILLDNAIKHTPAGGKVTAAAQTIDASHVTVSVSDTGPGIPAEDLSRIFERFYQVDKSRARKKGGAGLGLAIAKEIVAAHGGNIIAESIVGMGSKFTVQLPLAGPKNEGKEATAQRRPA
jgi:two-component system OmpR family sensor kinase